MRLLGLEFATCLWTSRHLHFAICSRNSVWNTRIKQFPALPEGGTNFTVIVLYLSEWCLCTCSQTGHSTHIVVSQLKTTVASPLVFDVCHVAVYSHIWAWLFVQHCTGIP